MDDRVVQLILLEAKARKLQVDLRNVVGQAELLQKLDAIAVQARNERLKEAVKEVDQLLKRARK